MDVVNKLVGVAGETKPTPNCSFLYHLFKSQGFLIEEEEMDYKAAQELTRYRITPKTEPESAPASNNEVIVITAPRQPVQQLEAQQPPQQPNWNKRMKQIYRVPARSPPVRSRGEGSWLQLEPEARSKS